MKDDARALSPCLAFLRHGTAEPGTLMLADRERQLVDEGKREVERTAASFVRSRLEVSAAFTSPYPRARTTAEVFLANVAIGAGVALAEDERLVPEANAQATARWVTELGLAKAEGSGSGRDGASVLLFVAHEPILSDLVSRLVGRRRRALEKAELVLVGRDGVGWQEITSSAK